MLDSHQFFRAAHVVSGTRERFCQVAGGELKPALPRFQLSKSQTACGVKLRQP